MRLPLLLLSIIPWVSSFAIPIKLAAVVNQTEQAEVMTQHGYVWTTTIIVGTPGKAFTVQVDTNSGFLWIADVRSNATAHSTYDQNQSSTHKSVTTTTSYYVETKWGVTSGPVGVDTVILGESFASDTSRTSITVPNASFGQSTDLPSFDFPDYLDGVLGLAFPFNSPANVQPVFMTAINQGDVKEGTFVIWLEDQYESDDNGTHGVIYYGNTDNLHCQTEINHYPLSATFGWMFRVPAITSTVPNTRPYTPVKQFTAYIDTTSPYISIPVVQFDNIMRQLNINVNQQFPTTVPCDLKIDISFDMPYGEEHVNERNLVIKRTDGTCQLQLINTNYDKFGDGSNYYNLGTPFLRGRCTFFDQARQMIGFSQPLTHAGH